MPPREVERNLIRALMFPLIKNMPDDQDGVSRGFKLFLLIYFLLAGLFLIANYSSENGLLFCEYRFGLMLYVLSPLALLFFWKIWNKRIFLSPWLNTHRNAAAYSIMAFYAIFVVFLLPAFGIFITYLEASMQC